MAVRLVSEIGRVFSKRLPVSFVFQAPTIEAMAARLRGELRADSFVVPLREGGRRPPFFCGGPRRREFQELSRALGPEQPFFQLDVFNLQEERELAGEPLYRSVVELASAFRKHIASIQPSGPYFLGGLCDGGIIAFEIALQLQAEGYRVGLLAEFDTPVAGYFQRSRIQWLQYGYWLISSGEIRNRFRLHMRRWFSSSPEEERLFRIWRVIWEAIRAYRPDRVFDGEVQLFRASNPHTWFIEDVVTGWEVRASQGVRVHELACEHVTFFCDPTSQRVIDRVIEQAYRRTLVG
jgi:thioesterase domain-containing protein